MQLLLLSPSYCETVIKENLPLKVKGSKFQNYFNSLFNFKSIPTHVLRGLGNFGFSRKPGASDTKMFIVKIWLESKLIFVKFRWHLYVKILSNIIIQIWICLLQFDLKEPRSLFNNKIMANLLLLQILPAMNSYITDLSHVFLLVA